MSINKKIITILTILSMSISLSFASIYQSQYNSESPITITSKSQNINLVSNTATFQTNVVITQNNIILNANKVVVIKDQSKNNNKSSIKTITAYGNPVRFSDVLSDGKTIKGVANKIIYSPVTNMLYLYEKPSISEENNIITGTIITYNTQTHNLSATSNSNEQVQSVLYPSQLKNN
ncbi:MAG: lipopolysaccharide transport periplasmic protein LptA [Psittacicella sp.]